MLLTRRKLLVATGTAVVVAPGIGSWLTGPRDVEVNAVRDQSIWTAQVPQLPKFNKLTGQKTADLLVIGGGYTGLSCAYYTKMMRPNWKVILIDSHEIGSGASSRNTGAVYAKQQGINDQEFADRGLARLFSFIEQQEIDCDLIRAPTLMLLTSKSAASEAKSNLNPGEVWLTSKALEKSIGSRYYAGAVDTPNFYKVQPAKLVAGHVKAALSVGVELFENSPALEIKHGKVAAAITPEGQINAKQVMLATNAYTPRLGIKNYKMFPIHQYSLATRKLNYDEIQKLGLDKWTMRFELGLSSVTFSLTPSGHFFLRMVLGYASHNSEIWKESSSAKALAQKIFEQRYPGIRDLALDFGWHGLTGHTPLLKPIVGMLGKNNVHISVAYNGLGIMPGHNSGYLSACRITGIGNPDLKILEGASSIMPFPGEFYRSMILKPAMNILQVM